MTGFHSKREAAADKLQEPVNLLEARRIAAEYGTPDSQVDDGNLYFALSKCLEHIDALPAQEPVAWTLLLTGEHHGIIGAAGEKFIGAPEYYKRVDVYTTPPQREWVGLTAEEIASIPSNEYTLQTAERLLKEKNT